MFGKNPKLPPTKGDGTILDIVEIFPTFQGEGPYAGHPAIFIRLGGCNLACSFCDTSFDEYTSETIQSTLKRVQVLSVNQAGQRVRQLVVITGGEPLRQPIGLACEELLKAGYTVQIETNGTLYRDIPDGVDIICSPKVTNGSYHAIRPDLLPKIMAFKFLMSASHEGYQEVPELGQSEYNIPVYVQSMDEYTPEKNYANQQFMLEIAADKGYKVSIQMHKVLEIP